MKRLFVFAILSLTLTLLLNCQQNDKSNNSISANVLPEDTVVVASPGYGENIFENKYVKLIKVSLAPGEAFPSHQVPTGAVYALSDAKLELKKDDLKSYIDEMFKNHTYWQDSTVMSIKNIGNNKAEYLEVIRKESALPENLFDYYLAMEEDTHQETTSEKTAVFENDRIRVLEVSLVPGNPNIPGNTTQRDRGLAKLIYPLSPCSLKYYDNSEKNQTEKSFRAGEAFWDAAGPQKFHNIGSANAQFLIFEFKE